MIKERRELIEKMSVMEADVIEQNGQMNELNNSLNSIEVKSNYGYLLIKRMLDIILASLGIVVFIIPMCLIAILIKIEDSKGSSFFKQNRYGLNGKRFSIMKFRTMITDAEKVLEEDKELYEKYILNGYKLPKGEDPRIMKIGGFLRKSSLDELPQLFNVLKGEMSFVGPRPILDQELINEYGVKKDLFLSVKPGITGYWQAYGRSNITYPQRTEMELYYIKNTNLIFDLKIIIKTFISVIQREGAY